MRPAMNRFLLASCMFVHCMFAAMPAHAAAPQAEAPQAAARTLVLVRHGHYVEDPKIDGRIGPQLSSLGSAQAHLAGARLAGTPGHFDGLYVSPMQRARDTAAIIGQSFPGRHFEVVDDLAECMPPTRRAEASKDEKPEDLAACKVQLDRAFERFFQPAAGKPQTDLLVCHGNVTRYMVTRALGVDTAAWLEMSVRHASITIIRVEADGRFKVIAVGDAGHIPPSLLSGATGDPAGPRLAIIPELP